MDRWCSLAWPSWCVDASFTLPVYEILASAVVSGLVTWATIYFSVRQARRETDRAIDNANQMAERALAEANKQTDRALDAAMIADLRRTISDLSLEAQQLFDSASKEYPRKSGTGAAASNHLRQSDLPHAKEVAEWVDAFIHYTTTLNAHIKLAKAPIRAQMKLFHEDFRSPGATVARELYNWLLEPEVHGRKLSTEAESLEGMAYEMRTDLIRGISEAEELTKALIEAEEKDASAPPAEPSHQD